MTLEAGGIASVSANAAPDDDELPEAPPAATLVHEHVNAPGNVSATPTDGSLDGPAFATTIVYVIVEEPGTADVTPSVLVTEMSAVGTSTVSESVAELFPGTGSATDAVAVAVFDNVPVAIASIEQVTV